MQSETLIEKAEEILDEEEDPQWVKGAQKIIDSSRSYEFGKHTHRHPSELEEHKIAMMRRQCKLQQDQNKLMCLLITAIEAQDCANPHFMGVNAIKAKKIVNNYDY